VKNTRIAEKFINSLLIPNAVKLLSRVVSQEKIIFFLEKLFPQRDLAKWKHAKENKQWGTNLFAKMDRKGNIHLKEIVNLCKNKNSRILDLGCNQGRYLKALKKQGYKNLTGVDIGVEATNLAKKSPALNKVLIVNESFYSFLSNTPDLDYEVTYSRGATLELVPSFLPIVREICRVTRYSVALLIQENGHSFPRFWEYEFNQSGFHSAKIYRPVLPQDEASLLIFHRK